MPKVEYRIYMEGGFQGGHDQEATNGVLNFASTREEVLSILRLLALEAMEALDDYNCDGEYSAINMDIQLTKEYPPTCPRCQGSKLKVAPYEIGLRSDSYDCLACGCQFKVDR